MKDTLLPQKVVNMYCFNNNFIMSQAKDLLKLQCKITETRLQLQELKSKKKQTEKDLAKIEELKLKLEGLL